MSGRFEIDLRARTVTRYSPSGAAASFPLPPGVWEQSTSIERLCFSPGVSELHVGLPGGEEAAVELRRDTDSAEELLDGRPILYLDQNKWSSMAAWKFGHREVLAEEAQAAQQLAALVENRQILLPISAAHLVETTPLHGERRIALASTVLQLGRGWQMRNPLHVRVEEMALGLRGQRPVAGDVFAPHADAFFSYQPESPIENLPGPWAELAAAIPGVLGLYDAIVDAEAIPDEGGVAAAAAACWAKKHAELAAQLRAEGADKHLTRRVVHGHLLLDMADDLLRLSQTLNLDADEIMRRLTVAEDPVGQMPFLAQLRQMLFARVRNAEQRWESSDLIDTLFLSCAAGYADVVVGEKNAVGYLRQAQNPPSKATLTASLSEAVSLLSASDGSAPALNRARADRDTNSALCL